jgi:hypothetical protein
MLGHSPLSGAPISGLDGPADLPDEGDGVASGSATVSGVGGSLVASVGASSGTCAVSGAGAAVAAGQGSAAGTGAASGEGDSDYGSTGSATGTSTASGVSGATKSATGAAAGSATVSGAGQGIGEPEGSATVVVRSISLALSIAQGPRLLSEPLPLHLSTQLGAFEEERPLAHRYGDLRKSRFRLLKLSSARYFVAEHAMQSVTRVFVDNLETRSFAIELKNDDAGNVWTEVVLGAPAPLGATVTACGTGKLHPTTGALIENPADIADDIMRIAGRDYPWFGQLRSECAVRSIALAGSLDAMDSIQAHLDSVISSAGGIWSYAMARLYPLPVGADSFVVPLDRFAVRDLRVSASLTDTADVLRLAYDFDEAEGRAASFVQLRARPQRFGGIHADVSMPWLRGAAAAESCGTRLLQRLAGTRFDVEFTTDASEFIRPGTWTLLQDVPQWPFAENPHVMILRVSIDERQRFARVYGETILDEPAVDLIAHSLGIPGIGQGGLEVEFANGIATLTVRDNEGRPLLGALVSLDGSAPLKTDAQGKVRFTTTRGEHIAAVEAEGFLPYEVGFDLQ